MNTEKQIQEELCCKHGIPYRYDCEYCREGIEPYNCEHGIDIQLGCPDCKSKKIPSVYKSDKQPQRYNNLSKLRNDGYYWVKDESGWLICECKNGNWDIGHIKVNDTFWVEIDEFKIFTHEELEALKAEWQREQWISAESGKLPEPLKTVWISNGKGFTTLGCLVESDGGYHWAQTNGIIYEENGEIVSECESDDLDVKYWMTLPKPPKIN